MRFANKTAIVTGGGTGIGAAVARQLNAEGAQVVLTGRRVESLLEVAKGSSMLPIAADAANPADVERLIADVSRRFGGVDILIANAGGHGVGPTVSMSDETWAASVRANLDTAFVTARACLPKLIERKGAIVIISSIAGLFAGPNAAGYVTMKHACIGFGKSLARDYGRQGVRTNIICPGWVRTAMADEQMQHLVAKHALSGVDEAYSLVTRDVPLARPAAPEEVASVICFAASPEAAMMNGAIITVDGGASVVDLPTLAFVD